MSKARRELSASTMAPTCIFCANDLERINPTAADYYDWWYANMFNCKLCKSGLSNYAPNSKDASKYETWYENGPTQSKTVEVIRLEKYALRQDYETKETTIYTLLPIPLIFQQEPENPIYHFDRTVTIPILENLNLSKLTDNQIEAYLLLS